MPEEIQKKTLFQKLSGKAVSEEIETRDMHVY